VKLREQLKLSKDIKARGNLFDRDDQEAKKTSYACEK
jgi:hypothetical protein